MWMRFVRTTNQGRSFLPDQANITAVSSYNGLLCIGSTSATQAGISGVDFCKDVLWRYDNLADRSGYGGFNIAQRAIATLLDNITTTIVNRSVNAIAMTVLPDAPTDPATGLRVPTIAVATAGGISLIRHDGVVRNSSLTTGFEDIDINPYMLSVSDNASSTWFYAKNPGSLGASFTMLTVPATAGPTFGTSAIQSFRRKARAEYVRRGGARVNLLRLNEDVSGRSISADMTNTYNTGWLTGDIRRCYLSDATTGTPIGGQLIVNGGFDIDASGWSGDGSFSVSNGELTWVVGTIYHKIWQAINVVPGTRYLVSYKRVSGTGTFELRVGTSALTNNVATASHVAIGAFYLSFTATTSVVYVGIQANNLGTYVLDDFSVTAIVDDRSYKAALSTITGTLTKSQLASGTSLIAYSGWSNSNYLREPYSTDLDFGTGEFNASAWMNIPATLPALSTVTTLSANQITNGTFASGLTGWSVSNANGTTNVISVSGGKAVYSTVGGTTLTLSQSCGLIGGRSYKITFDVSNYNGPDKIRVRFGTNAVVADINANGPVTLYYTYASSTGDYISFINSVNQALSFEIDNIVVQEILPYSIIDRSHSSGPRFTLALTPGGYLTATAFDGVTTRIVTTSATYNTAQWLKADVNYTTDGSLAISVNGREVVATRGTPLGNMTLGKNLIPFSESFDNSTWIKSNSTVTANVSTAPDGTLTADKLIANTGSVAAQTNQLIATTAISYGFSVYAKAAEFSQIQLSNDGITSTAFFDLSAGTIGATVGATASITSVGNGWYRCGIVFTNIAGTPRHRIYVANGGSTTVTGNGVNGVLIWGAQLETGASITSYAATNVAPLTIGNSFALNTPFPGSIALLKLSATVPTPEQTTFMYEQEKQLFRPGAQSILPDSGSIVDMAYDDATDRWVAVSASNESYWTGLVRNSVTAVPTGSYSRVASASGVELTSRSTLNTGVDVTIPPYGLREEIVKKSESASRLSRQIATYDYVGGFTGNITTGSTAIASVTNLTYPTSYIGARISGTGIPTNATITGVSGTTIYISAPATATTTGLTISFLDFILPVGQEAKIVMSAGTIRREGSTADYTRLYDGFRETIRFATAPGTTAWVQIQSTRIPQ
jgi:hypothetical protein